MNQMIIDTDATVTNIGPIIDTSDAVTNIVPSIVDCSYITNDPSIAIVQPPEITNLYIGPMHGVNNMIYQIHPTDLRMKANGLDITLSANKVFGDVQITLNKILREHLANVTYIIVVKYIG